MDLQALCMDVVELSREVGMFIKMEEQQVSKQQIEEKSLNSLVSYVDKTAEEKIVSRLGELLPEAGFVAEEGTSDKSGEVFNWIIDPLDGTTNFLHGIPVYSVSIALQQNAKIVIGVVYEVNRDECFYSWQGGAAYLNNEIMQVSPCKQLSESLLATGFPYYDYQRIEAYFALLKELSQKCRGIRRMGSAAVDLAYVACGRFESFFEYSLHPWDVAAGAFLVQQAGGKVADFNWGDNWLEGKEIISSAAGMHQEMLSLLSKHMA
jgi:myo-inositol-1(or 4)-monophosphatase